MKKEEQRWQTLRRVEEWLETPMVVLGFVWLILLIIELIHGLTAPLELAGTVIWVVFIIEFAVRLVIAPRRRAFLVTNWLTLIALAIPALRVLRFARAFAALRTLRLTRGLRFVRLLTTLNRGMRSLGRSLGRHGFGYVVGLTVLVTFAGAAGMYAFEGQNGGILRSYGDALWWTAMIITTLGSDAWPQSVEGRVLCLLLAIYALGVFGYVAATLASFFVGSDAQSGAAALGGESSVAGLRSEITALRAELRTVRERLGHVTE